MSNEYELNLRYQIVIQVMADLAQRQNTMAIMSSGNVMSLPESDACYYC